MVRRHLEWKDMAVTEKCESVMVPSLAEVAKKLMYNSRLTPNCLAQPLQAQSYRGAAMQDSLLLLLRVARCRGFPICSTRPPCFRVSYGHPVRINSLVPTSCWPAKLIRPLLACCQTRIHHRPRRNRSTRWIHHSPLRRIITHSHCETTSRSSLHSCGISDPRPWIMD